MPQLLGGLGWAAFNLSTANFIYDSIEPKKRAVGVAYFNMITGVALALGALLGGYLAQNLAISFMNTLLFVFLISGTARIIVSIIFLHGVKEVRKVRRIPSYALGRIKPVAGFFHELIWIVENISKEEERFIKKESKLIKPILTNHKR